MKILKKYKNKILIVVIIIVAAIGYNILFGGEENNLLMSESVNAVGKTEDDELISLLINLRLINLDGSIFSDPVFRSLEDFGQKLAPESVGRNNPFAPIGVDANRDMLSDSADEQTIGAGQMQ